MLEQHDPLAVLAQAAELRRYGRWWDDLVEHGWIPLRPSHDHDAMVELRMIMAKTAALRSGKPDVRRTCVSGSGRPSRVVAVRGRGWRRLQRLYCVAAAPAAATYGPAWHASTQDHLDLGAVDVISGSPRHRLWGGVASPGLVSPSWITRARTDRRALAGQGGPIFACPGSSRVERPCHRGGRLAETLASCAAVRWPG